MDTNESGGAVTVLDEASRTPKRKRANTSPSMPTHLPSSTEDCLPSETLGSLFDHITDPLLLVEESGEIQFANASFQQKTGFSSSALIGRCREFPFFFRSVRTNNSNNHNNDNFSSDNSNSNRDTKNQSQRNNNNSKDYLRHSSNNNYQPALSSPFFHLQRKDYEQLFLQCIERCVTSGEKIYDEYLELSVVRPNANDTNRPINNNESSNNNSSTSNDMNRDLSSNYSNENTGTSARDRVGFLVSFFPLGSSKGNPNQHTVRGSRPSTAPLPRVYCLFKQASVLKDNTLVDWTKLTREGVLQIASIAAYDEKLQDIIPLFATNRALAELMLNENQIMGRYLISDSGFPRSNVDPFLELFKQPENASEQPHMVEGEVILEDGNTGTQHSKWIRAYSRFLGYHDVRIEGKPELQRLPLFFMEGQNITEEKRLQQELRQGRNSLESFLAMLNKSPLVIGLVELERTNAQNSLPVGETPSEDSERYEIRYRFVNTYSAKALLKEPDQIIGKTASEIGLPPARIQFYVDKCKEALFSKGEPVVYDSVTDTAYLSCFLTHLEGNQFVYIAQDISKHKQLERQLQKSAEQLEEVVERRTHELQQALTMKSRFVAVVSHELRTPLSGIMGTLSLLNEPSQTLTEEQRDLINVGKVCGEQLLVVVNDVLDLTKLEESKMTLQITPFSLQNLFEECIEVLSFEADRKEIELLLDLVSLKIDRVDTVLGDPARIRQIIINLLSNAVKFTEKKGAEVLMTVEVVHNQEGFEVPMESEDQDKSLEILVSVRDQGIGIPETAKEKIFEPFVQADNNLTKRIGGTGLGLSICKRLSELMKGNISVESTEGKGSTFFFKFKAQKARNQPIQASPSQPYLPTREQLPSVHTNVLVPTAPSLSNTNPTPTSRQTYSRRISIDEVIQPLCRKSVLIVDKSATLLAILSKQFTSWNITPITADNEAEALRLLDTLSEPPAVALIDRRLSSPELASKLQQLARPIGEENQFTNNNNRPTSVPIIEMIYLSQKRNSHNPRSPKIQNNGQSVSSIANIKSAYSLKKPIRETTLISVLSMALNVNSNSAPTQPADVNSNNAVPEAPLDEKQNIHLLIAEDNEINQRLIKRVVKSLGYTNVVIVDNGVKAVEQVQQQPFDIILMDVMMPEMDGLEATRQIRSLGLPVDVQPFIIALTADAFVQNRNTCLASGMNDVLTKPINRGQLEEVLEKYSEKVLERRERQ